MTPPTRKELLEAWLSDLLNTKPVTLHPMTGDAGFRRYYRTCDSAGMSVIAVDSPVELCNNQAFVAIQQAFAQQGVLVPVILGMEPEQGFFCLSDLGNVMLADQVTLESVNTEYEKVIRILPQIRQSQTKPDFVLPCFDRGFIQTELSIFSQWLLNEYLSLSLNAQEQLALQSCFDFLIAAILEQPQYVMHRDFHSRNIMRVDSGEYAVIDFQDAVRGPVTYDVVSLLRDCYVQWPQANIDALLAYFIEAFEHQFPEAEQYEYTTWKRWFDLTGLQRHVKVAGIFSRLYLRDGKSGYLSDIPLTLDYIVNVSANYPELTFLHDLVQSTVIPALQGKQS